MSHTYTNISGNRGLSTTDDMYSPEKEPDAAPLGLGIADAIRVPRLRHRLVRPKGFLVWIHVGPQLITPCPRGEGPAKPGVRSCFLCAQSTTPSPTRRLTGPPSRKRARAVVN